MSITVEQARSLAVCYHAFMAADLKEQPREIVVWGGMLLDDQRETGVEMFPASWLESVIKTARLKLETQSA